MSLVLYGRAVLGPDLDSVARIASVRLAHSGITWKMNVDLAERMSPVDSEPLQRPIQRAKRTYGNKPKPITSEDDMRLSEPSFGASMVTAYTALDEHPRPTMTTSGYIPGRWLTDLKDMDKDIDDGEEDKDPHLRVAGEANGKQMHTILKALNQAWPFFVQSVIMFNGLIFPFVSVLLDRPSRKRKDAHSHASSPPSDGTSRSASRQGRLICTVYQSLY